MKNHLPWIILAIFTLWIASSLRHKESGLGIDHVGFGQLPVLLNGRIQPLDSVAMNALLQIRGTRKVPLEGNGVNGEWGNFLEIRSDKGPLTERNWYQFSKHPKKLSSAEWLMEVMIQPERADEHYIFAVNHPDLISELKLQKKGLDRSGLRFFTFTEIQPHLQKIEGHASGANPKPELRTPFERAVVKLHFSLRLFLRLKNSLQPQDTTDFATELDDYLADISPGVEAVQRRAAGEDYDQVSFDNLMRKMERYDMVSRFAYPLLIPPDVPNEARDQWSNMGTNLLDVIHSRKLPAAVKNYADMSSAYVQEDSESFSAALAAYRSFLGKQFGSELKKARIEYRYNQFSPFYKSIVLYVVAFIFACLSWFNLSSWMNRSAYYLIILAAIVHSAGLITRMILEGRPPVTNLYSSAIFVGWGAVILGIVLEWFYRDGIGSVIASVVGFLTLIIAHNLSMSGDTMEMMRAVLDTNFWLATHVVVITLGYSATFVAGFLALVYIIRGLLTKTLSRSVASGLNRMVYGIICFATLFSFVGTILGGIWADQSWGRFWGWDPKENGALLIVIWNALILHCRWGGLVRERGLMNLAVFGNIVTAFSWFGVNLLSIGLHNYGFMEGSFMWIMLFTGSQLAFIILGTLPLRYWQSFKGKAATMTNASSPQAA
ncbi:MAG: Cytochrome c biogenesis protein CcsA [Verrucomicrobia subdivision 3 bacterium]|nr:Cytochrome c biogenesis protein CcsA [Limisphaerales bacterium]MCS1414502.1 Cytochrome c biogenesis protein CcsA [Limisphaerales bacterium]